MAQELARYETDSGEVALTDADVKLVIARNENVTNAEMKMFIELCKAHQLNPFMKEAYLIKYGSSPATIVVGKDVFTKRAFRHPRFRGMQAGVIVMGEYGGKTYTKEREGSMVFPHEQVMGGWAKVYIEGYEQPVYDSVSMQEYSTGKSNWAGKPGTMIRKTALVHALREAFPEEFNGLYDAAEMGVELPADTAQVEAVAEAECVPVYEEARGAGDAPDVPEAPVTGEQWEAF